MQKLMTYSYILLVSAAASFDISHITPLFKDVIFLCILFTGIIMSLTLDNNRPDVNRKITFLYVVFSVAASFFFSAFAIAAYIELSILKFYFYILVGAAATLSPQVARKILPEAPDALKKGAFQLLGAFFTGVANKINSNINLDQNNKKDETE